MHPCIRASVRPCVHAWLEEAASAPLPPPQANEPGGWTAAWDAGPAYAGGSDDAEDGQRGEGARPQMEAAGRPGGDMATGLRKRQRYLMRSLGLCLGRDCLGWQLT